MYDYEQMISEASEALASIQGRILHRVLVQEVGHEFNVVYLITEVGAYAVQGRIGSEVLVIVPMEQPPSLGLLSNTSMAIVKPFRPFSMFEGRRIVQGRSIGGAWNGHGFELSFEGQPNRTLIIQSIYTDAKPDGYEDCLRLGIGNYVFDTESEGVLPA